ncbi:MAG: DUF1045 domain-containing protein [Magnetovibrionaceae bacterium]
MRYALYFAPAPDSLLWQAGATWLGRNPYPQSVASHQPAVPGLSPERFHDLTRAPRRYGFHGTLKAPFRLAQAKDVKNLMAALDSFCSLRHPFVIEDVAPRLISQSTTGFLALCPRDYSQPLADLAADCVHAFDVFRDELTEAEIERRLKSGLSDRQRDLLDRWGYPYVMEEFNFHMTLTGPIATGPIATGPIATGPIASGAGASEPAANGEAEQLRRAAETHFAKALIPGLRIDAISLFLEEQPGADFRFIRRYAFA